MEELSQEEQYQLMKGWLNERQWRLYVATEDKRIGVGGISQVAREAGVTRKTIRKGIRELEAGARYQPGERLRKPGGGRKKVTAKDARLGADLEEMLEPKGDPQSLIRWTSKSVSKLKEALTSQGHAIGETAEFAVESIRRWWQSMGSKLYPTSEELLIVADGGGSNGARNRLWKQQLQRLANESGLAITVCHLPPATSKWNKIEHRLFSYISINWRGKPLTSLETIIELISHTSTEEGLTVTAVKDMNSYPTGLKVSDEDMAALKITSHAFHGDWNYTIQPQ